MSRSTCGPGASSSRDMSTMQVGGWVVGVVGGTVTDEHNAADRGGTLPERQHCF